MTNKRRNNQIRAGLLVGVLAAAWQITACGASDLWPSMSSPVATNPDIEKRIDGLLSRMSLEEKVGQVIQGEIQNVTPADLREYHLGSVLNGGGSFPGKNKLASPTDWVALADDYYHASMDTTDGGVAIPVIWGTDAVHGHSNVFGATLFPHNIGLGAARNPELIRRIGKATAIEVAVTGIPWTFAPTLAVARDDRWGRSYESYSEDPDIVGEYARQMVLGIQGDPGTEDFLGHGHLLATAKHFLADGGTTNGVDQGDTVLTESELVRLHAEGYFGALGAGAQTVMASFSSWNGEKMHGNRYLLTEILKQRLGFDGFVVGDWNGHGQVPGCNNESCAQALNAGVDMFMAPDGWKGLWHNTLAQVKSGEVPMARLDDAVRRILRVKIRAGLFEKGAPSSWPHAGQSDLMGSQDHRALARQAVRESLVLLKNDGGLLPLNPSMDVLVAGAGADNIGMQSGGWTLSWQGTGNQNSDFPGATSIFAGIHSAVSQAGGSAYLSVKGEYSEKPDVAIVVFGEQPYAEFNGDRAHLQFNATDQETLAILQELKSGGIPVVSVFLSGRPMWANPELNASDAFVAAWLPGSEGAGVADVLFQAADGSVPHPFSGRLSFSWPASPEQGPLNVGDEDYRPLFDYGYGLSGAESDLHMATLEENGLELPEGGPLKLFVGTIDADWTIFAFTTNDHGSTQAFSDENFSVGFSDTTAGLPSVDKANRRVQEDAVAIEWESGKPGIRGAGIAVATVDGVMDHSSLVSANGQIQFDLRIISSTADTLALGASCGEGPGECGGWVDLSAVTDGFADGEWRTYNVDLGCLVKGGVDFSRVSAPFILGADGPMKIEISDVAMVPNPGTDASGPCVPLKIISGEDGWEFAR